MLLLALVFPTLHGMDSLRSSVDNWADNKFIHTAIMLVVDPAVNWSSIDIPQRIIIRLLEIMSSKGIFIRRLGSMTTGRSSQVTTTTITTNQSNLALPFQLSNSHPGCWSKMEEQHRELNFEVWGDTSKAIFEPL